MWLLFLKLVADLPYVGAVRCDLWSSHRTVGSHLWGGSNIWTLWISCSRKLVRISMLSQRWTGLQMHTFSMFIYVSGMALHVSKTSLSGLGRFSISFHLCSLVRVAFWRVTPLGSAVRLLTLDTHKTLSAMSASSISISTYPCECGYVQQGWVDVQRCDREGQCFSPFWTR